MTALEKAAWKYAPDLSSYIGHGISIAPETRDDFREAFIEGGLWMLQHIEDYIKVLKENQNIQEE